MAMSIDSTSIKKTSQLHQNNQWADLPEDILLRIIKCLDLKTDLSRVRGVCPTWRSALPLADFPMNKSHIEVPSLDEGDNLPLLLFETRIFLFSPLPSAKGSDDTSDRVNSSWIAKMIETGRNKWHLLNPISNSYRDYFTTDPPVIGEINLLDCRILELARPMCLVHGLDYKGKAISKKVVGEWDMTSSSQSVVLVQIENKESDVLLMLKSGDEEWVKIDAVTENEKLQNMTFKILDIAYHNGKFYFIQMMSGPDDWRVGIINPYENSQFLQFKNGISTIREPFVYLVPSKSNDCLYLLPNVPKGDKPSSKLDKVIFLVEQEESQWQSVESLRDEILFIGDYVSFTLNRSALDHISQWNSISLCQFCTKGFVDIEELLGINLFLECSYKIPKGAESLKHAQYCKYSDHLRYYIMEKGFLLFNQSSEGDEHDRDVCNRLFFPPPAWVKWCCLSFDNAEVKLDCLGFKYDDSAYEGGYSYIDELGDYVADLFDDSDYEGDGEINFLNETLTIGIMNSLKSMKFG